MMFNNPSQADPIEREFFYKHNFDYIPGKSYLDTKSSYLPANQMPTSGLESTLSAIDGKDFTDILAGEKSHFAQEAANTLGELIQDRRKIKELNIERIDYDSCHAITLIYSMNQWSPEQDFDRRRQGLDMTLFGLERERRMEEVNYWRDCSLIKEKFTQATADYAAAKRKEEMMWGIDR